MVHPSRIHFDIVRRKLILTCNCKEVSDFSALLLQRVLLQTLGLSRLCRQNETRVSCSDQAKWLHLGNDSRKTSQVTYMSSWKNKNKKKRKQRKELKKKATTTAIIRLGYPYNSLRSKRFRGFSEQKKSEERDFRSFGRAKNGARAKKWERGEGERKERKRLQTNPRILKTPAPSLIFCSRPSKRMR